MNETDEKKISIDILKHVEDLSNKVNKMMAPKAQAVLLRYPITFGLLILLGVIALHEGIKGVLKEFGLLDINPWYLLTFGVLVLIVTGVVYKKLED